jgi:hypothetical protein
MNILPLTCSVGYFVRHVQLPILCKIDNLMMTFVFLLYIESHPRSLISPFLIN